MSFRELDRPKQKPSVELQQLNFTEDKDLNSYINNILDKPE